MFHVNHGWNPRCQSLKCSLAGIIFTDIASAIAGSLDIGSFTAAYTVALSASGGVAAVSVEAHVTYTPSTHARSLFSLSSSPYTFAAMQGARLGPPHHPPLHTRTLTLHTRTLRRRQLFACDGHSFTDG